MPKEIKTNKIIKKIRDIKADVYDISGKKSGTISLPGHIFNYEVSPVLLAQAVRVYQANKRSGTHSTKTRGEVTGSTRKIYKQKGTGRARHGDIKAPIFVGGGIAHGPHPKDYSLGFSKTMKKKALIGALSQKVAQNQLKVVSGFAEVNAKTREVVKALVNLNLTDKKKVPNILLVMPGKLDKLYLAGRNIAGLMMKSVNLINALDILLSKEIIFMKESVTVIGESMVTKDSKRNMADTKTRVKQDKGSDSKKDKAEVKAKSEKLNIKKETEKGASKVKSKISQKVIKKGVTKPKSKKIK